MIFKKQLRNFQFFLKVKHYSSDIKGQSEHSRRSLKTRSLFFLGFVTSLSDLDFELFYEQTDTAILIVPATEQRSPWISIVTGSITRLLMCPTPLIPVFSPLAPFNRGDSSSPAPPSPSSPVLLLVLCEWAWEGLVCWETEADKEV